MSGTYSTLLADIPPCTCACHDGHRHCDRCCQTELCDDCRSYGDRFGEE